MELTDFLVFLFNGENYRHIFFLFPSTSARLFSFFFKADEHNKLSVVRVKRGRIWTVAKFLEGKGSDDG